MVPRSGTMICLRGIHSSPLSRSFRDLLCTKGIWVSWEIRSRAPVNAGRMSGSKVTCRERYSRIFQHSNDHRNDAELDSDLLSGASRDTWKHTVSVSIAQCYGRTQGRFMIRSIC
jgi:hypothetical protein